MGLRVSAWGDGGRHLNCSWEGEEKGRGWGEEGEGEGGREGGGGGGGGGCIHVVPTGPVVPTLHRLRGISSSNT